jgi:mRNA interferase RelE/StbE
MSETQDWVVLFHRDFEREIRLLPKQAIRRVMAALEELVTDPRPPGSGKVKGHALWKQRVGPYRIVYAIDEERHEISLYRIGHRKNVYWDL